MSSYTYLAHYGTKGMKWGARKYQNKDGSLTPLGRVHYGVGAARSAAHNVKEAIRKKVAPTNVELNAQIRKQRSKNLNKQKREELKQLKKGKDPRAESKSEASGTHKRFYDMTDKEIQDKINRLTNEIKLADLEVQASLTPGKRFLYTNLKSGAGKAISDVTSSALTKYGKEFFGVSSDDGKKKEEKNKDRKKDEDITEATREYRRKTAEIKARQGYEAAKKKDADDKAAEKEAAKSKKEERKKAQADEFNRVRENVSNATSGYRERYEKAHVKKEPAEKAKVYYTWDPDERKKPKGYLR